MIAACHLRVACVLHVDLILQLDTQAAHTGVESTAAPDETAATSSVAFFATCMYM